MMMSLWRFTRNCRTINGLHAYKYRTSFGSAPGSKLAVRHRRNETAAWMMRFRMLNNA